MKILNFTFICALLLLSALSCSRRDVRTSSGLTREVLVESVTSWNGDTIPRYKSGQPRPSVEKVVIPPHSKLDMHSHDDLNIGIVESGELHLVDDRGRDTTLNAGSIILECVGRNHYGENLTDEDVVLYVIVPGVSTKEAGR